MQIHKIIRLRQSSRIARVEKRPKKITVSQAHLAEVVSNSEVGS